TKNTGRNPSRARLSPAWVSNVVYVSQPKNPFLNRGHFHAAILHSSARPGRRPGAADRHAPFGAGARTAGAEEDHGAIVPQSEQNTGRDGSAGIGDGLEGISSPAQVQGSTHAD